MIHAIVLIEAERSALAALGGELADIDGVAEAYSVTGEWDFVAILRLREPEQLASDADERRAFSRVGCCVLVTLAHESGAAMRVPRPHGGSRDIE